MGTDTARRVYELVEQSGYFALIAFRFVVPSVTLNANVSPNASERLTGSVPPMMDIPSRTRM